MDQMCEFQANARLPFGKVRNWRYQLTVGVPTLRPASPSRDAGLALDGARVPHSRRTAMHRGLVITGGRIAIRIALHNISCTETIAAQTVALIQFDKRDPHDPR